MHWYYADGTNQVGPLDDTAFDQLIQNGNIKPDTLVWRDGMANWQPLSQVRPGPQRLALKPHDAQPPVEAPPPTGEPITDPVAFAEQARTRDYSVDIGGSMSQGWELLKSNFWLLVGGTFLVYLIMFAFGLVPFAGWILQLVFQGPLMGGLYVMFLKQMRGDGATLGDAFSGFGPRFAQLMLTHMTMSILILFCFVPCLALAWGLVLKVMARSSPDEIQRAAEQLGPVMVPAIGLLVVGLLIATYLGTCWIFSLPLVADKGLSFWSAISLSTRVVNRHWFSMFALMVVGGFVVLLGLLGCCIGMFVTIPVFFGMILYTYESIFSPPSQT